MKYEEIWLKSKDGTKLQGWFMFHETDTRNRDTVIFFHENAGNIGLRLDYFELIYHNLNVNIVAIAYRGYSRSEGQPEQEGIIEDALATVQFCKKENRIDDNRVFIVGRSLGGAVAIHVMSKLDQLGDDYIKGVIIENTFTSICDMADALFSFLRLIQPIKRAMLRLRWESINEVQKIKKPVFFISGDQDTLVPTEMTYRLSEATKKSEFKETWIVPGGLHNNTFLVAGPMYYIRVR